MIFNGHQQNYVRKNKSLSIYAGLNTEKILMSQYGEYLHGLYVILIPYGLMKWPLAKIYNNFLLIYLPIKLSQFLLSKIETYLVIFFFSCCIVTKVQLITGQQTLLYCYFFQCHLCLILNYLTFFSGISYFKYMDILYFFIFDNLKILRNYFYL